MWANDGSIILSQQTFVGLEDVLKTCLEDVLKTCLEDLLKILWRQTKYLLGISTYLSRDYKYLTTLKRIQNTLITGDWFGVMKIA